ncbi:MAG: hypothetical protein IJS45_05020 [Clostridia bacterium]|nr:hypothetical protein [Clostridia bacterium]
MQSKSLKIIQVLAKIGKILSTIAFVCCIIGAAGCLIGLLALVIGNEALQIDGVTLHSLIESQADVSVPAMYVALCGGAIACLGQIVTTYMAKNYFKQELLDGTPFTFSGAKQLRTLGIVTVAVTAGSQLMIAVITGIVTAAYGSLQDMGSVELGTSFVTGLAYLVLSVVFTYGAEIAEKADAGNEDEQ